MNFTIAKSSLLLANKAKKMNVAAFQVFNDEGSDDTCKVEL